METRSIQVEVNQPLERLVWGFMLKERFGQVVFGTNTWFAEQVLEDLKVAEPLSFDIQFEARLGVGSYSCTLALTGGATHLEDNYHWVDLALVFKVINRDHVEFIGTNWLDPQFTIERG